jgi:hypothetical protein
MKNKFIKILCLLVFFTSSLSLTYAAENAFGSLPSVDITSPGDNFTIDTIDLNAHPLLQTAVTSNTIIGIMISPSVKIASVRTQNGDQYFVRIGDKLGNAEGVITDIKSDAIEVTEKGEVISLAVRNRSVTNEKSL